MNCPHCKKEIPAKTINKHFASRGGKASKRKISKEAQAKMQAGRKRKKGERMSILEIEGGGYCGPTDVIKQVAKQLKKWEG